MLLFKGKAADLSIDDVLARWLDGGTLATAAAQDLYGARGVPELADRLADRYPSVGEGNAAFQSDGSLTGYEVAITRDRSIAELKRLKTYPLSLAVIFTFLILAELERADLRRIAFGKMYGIPNERLEPLLVSPRL
jgi:vacuolar-type H+-ATPase subunit C/Vma6